MPLRWTTDRLADHLYFRVTGHWHIGRIRNLIDEIGRTAREENCHRVLCDIREVVGPFPEHDRFIAGAHTGERLREVKLALVNPEPLVTRKSGVDLANRLGAHVFSTGDIDEARRWLLSEG